MNSAIFARPPSNDGVVPDSLEVADVLYEDGAPVVFTTKSLNGEPLLAIVVQEDVDSTCTVLARATDGLEAMLRAGRMSVRDAITSGRMWLHRETESETNIWRISADEVDDYLPKPGTLLLPTLNPVVTTRAIGEKIKPGMMPASVVGFVADSTRKAIKGILDAIISAAPSGVQSTTPTGRPTTELRSLYDLPVQSFQFASFQVSFGIPDDLGFDNAELRQAISLLDQGLDWASSPTNDSAESIDPSFREAILRAVLLLTPTSGSVIEKVSLSGSWLSGTPRNLTSRSRAKVRGALKQLDFDQAVVYTGYVRELDVDSLSCWLRETDDGADHRCTFERELLDEFMDLLGSPNKASIAGVERTGKVLVSAITRSTIPHHSDDAEL